MLLKSSKVLFTLFLFYIIWFQDVFFQIPHMPLVLGFGMIFLLILHKMTTTKEIPLTITTPVFIWLFFVFFCLITGLFIAEDKSLLVNSLSSYIQTLIMVIYIINISVIEKSNNFFVKSYLILSVLYMFNMLFWGFDEKMRLTLSETSNANGDAMILLFGIFCMLLLFGTKKLPQLILSFGFIGLFIYTIILTGSRKAFLVALLLLLLWFVLIFIQHWKDYSLNKKIGSLLILTIGIAMALYIFMPLFFDSTLYWRLSESGYSIANNDIRSSMYHTAMRYFIENPLFGIGFDQYRYLSSFQTYSHSTYAEIISTTGIIGTVIYFFAYLIIFYNLIKLTIKAKGTKTSLEALQYLILLFVMLVLGTGVIHFYGIRDYIILALMISFYYVEKVEQKQII